jgi:hypothetical protein
MLLSASLLFQGCHSYQKLDRSIGCDLRGLESERIALLLQDGSWVESGANQHVEVTVPSHLIYGKRRSAASSLGKDRDGMTLLQCVEIESSWVLSPREGGGFQCRLVDGTVVTFEKGEYVVITPEDGAGIWVRGEKCGEQFQGMVPRDGIAQISVYRFSMEKTAILGSIGMSTVVSAFAAAIGGTATYQTIPVP